MMSRKRQILKEIKSLIREYKKYRGSNIFYHGSDIDNLEEFKVDESKFALLGAGVYFYKKKHSAKSFGKYIYKVDLSDWALAPKDFKFDRNDVEGFMHQVGLGTLFRKLFYRGEIPSGAYYPIWWVTEGFQYFEIKVPRSDVAHALKLYMTINKSYQGMVTTYPKGGDVAVVWEYTDVILPIKIS